MSKRKKDPQVSLVNQVVERRSELVEKLDHPLIRSIYTGMMISTREAGDHLFDPKWTATDVINRIRYMADKSELFVVTADMMDLLTHAAAKMPPQAVLSTDLPSKEGYVLFETPWIINDVNNMPIEVKSVLWREEVMGHAGVNPGLDAEGNQLPAIASGVVLYLFCDMGDPNDPLYSVASPKIRAEVPKDSLFHLMTAAYGRNVWSIDGSYDPETVRQVRKQMRSDHDIGSLITLAANNSEFREPNEDGSWTCNVVINGQQREIHMIPDQAVQFMSAFWHFVGSTLTDNGRLWPSKSTMKGLPRHTPLKPVTVVKLRRHESSGARGSGAWSLSYRYPRRGHWRKQWYGSADARFQREIWIAPTVVGDDSLPFNNRTVVNAVAQ